MRTFSKIESYQCNDPVVLSIGNFDGLHRGHQFLLQNNFQLATRLNAKSVVMTFYPHPLQILKPESFIASLSSQEEQALAFEQFGVDDWICEPFSRSFREESPESFWNRIIQSLSLKGLVVGPDFHFGKDRSGDVSLLQQYALRDQVSLLIPEPFIYKGQRVSSTLIRQYLVRGEIESANEFLGRSYFLMGKVISGFKRGRQIGFPTANIKSDQARNLKTGVYSTMVTFCGQKRRAATNIGFHPTVGEEPEVQVESHILDFDGNLYGEVLKIEFIEYLRSEIKFPNVESLKEQIRQDVQRVRLS